MVRAAKKPSPKHFWTQEHLYFDGDTYFEDVLAALDSARRTIDLETYIYDNDLIGLRFEAALMDAATRGVKVRCLVDGVGGGAWAERRGARVHKTGVQLRVYHPVLFSSVVSRLIADLKPKFLRGTETGEKKGALLSRLNRRDHRKMILIDDEVAFVGSLNISGSHSKRSRGPAAWRDTAVRLGGDDLLDLKSGFEYAWARAHTFDGKRHWLETLFPEKSVRLLKHRRRSPLVRSNYTLRLRRKNYREFSLRLARAKKRIWITNAYLAPSKPMMKKLTQAVKRGVDVRVLVPRTSDVFFMPWVATAHYPGLLKGGVKIFEYLPRFLHAKSVIIDDWATVGTSNLNRRSLLKDFEVDVVLTKTASLAQLEAQYKIDLAESEEVRGPLRGAFTAALGRLVIWLMKELI